MTAKYFTDVQRKETTMRRKAQGVAALGAIVALFALAGCSGGGASDQPAQSEPTVSTPVEETATPEPIGDFATAVRFTKLAHQNKHKQANGLVVPESPAARYIAHQVLISKAESIAGYDPSDEEPPSIKPDPAAGSIKIKYAKTEGQPANSYVWRDFTFEQGKITGWTGNSGPVKDVLWTRTTTDSKLSTKAKLESAYRANNGNLFVVVELSASKGRGFSDAEYTARGGYRQAVLEQNASDLSRGEKTLAYFVFKNAKFGGTLHIPFMTRPAAATATGVSSWSLSSRSEGSPSVKDWVIIVVSLGGLTFLALVLGGTITSGWAKSAAVVLLLIIGILGCGGTEPLGQGRRGRRVTGRPIGPHSLYWQCRHQGADAYRAGESLRDPYGERRPFSGRAWRDGWRAAASSAGLLLPHELAAI